MKIPSFAVTLTAIGLIAYGSPVEAQMYVGGGGRPTIEVNLDALDSLPQSHAVGRSAKSRNSRKAARMRAPVRTTFRDNSGEMVSYTGTTSGPMSYEQAVRMAGGTINNGGNIADEDIIESMPLSHNSYQPTTAYGRAGAHKGRKSKYSRQDAGEEASYDSVDNLNRLAVECSAGNMVARGQQPEFIPVSDSMPMAPPVTSAGNTSMPVPITMPANPVPGAVRARVAPQPVDLPDTPAITSAPLPPTPSIRTTAVPMDVTPVMQTAALAPALPPAPPSMPIQPIAMTPPPVPARLLPDDLKIDFSPNSETLPPDARTHLDRVVAKLAGSTDLRVELRSFATGSADMASKARRLALARALSVRSYLTGRGIDSERIDVRALGSTANAAPGDRVDIFLTR